FYWNKMFSFIRDLGYSGDITYLTDVNVDYLHQPWRAFATVINKCLSGKETGIDKIRLSHAQILWANSETSPKKKTTSVKTKTAQVMTKESTQKSKRIKRSAKKHAACIVIRDTPKVALSKAVRLKEATKRSKIDFHISQAGGFGTYEGTGSKPAVPDVPKYDSETDKESWGNSDEENCWDS
ncbi:hypothetical protein Tco_0725661, partial [Tanacetum coccineum]